MMGVVLPMYAIGIVIYLIYTLSKVFWFDPGIPGSAQTVKNKNCSSRPQRLVDDLSTLGCSLVLVESVPAFSPWSVSLCVIFQVFGKGRDKDTPAPDYLGGNNPFKDLKYDEEKKFVQSHNFEAEDLRDDLRGLTQSKKKQRDLERLLLKADERNISKFVFRPLLQASTAPGIGRPRRFHAKRGWPKPKAQPAPLSRHDADVHFVCEGAVAFWNFCTLHLARLFSWG